MKISELTQNLRPRERFLELGPESLSDAELFAIILRTGSKKENVIEVSNKLLSKFGLVNLFSCSIKELKEIKGIGESKAMQILTISEINKRKEIQKNKKIFIKQAKDVFDIFSEKLRNETKENFYILILNTKNKILGIERISLGILDSSIIHPREIFKPAIKNSASKIILVHNHPSGNPSPSDEDIEITQTLIDVGTLLGIEVMDHVIIGDGEFWNYQGNNSI